MTQVKIPATISDDVTRLRLGQIDQEIKSRLERHAKLGMRKPKPTDAEAKLMKELKGEVEELVAEKERLLQSGSLVAHFVGKVPESE